MKIIEKFILGKNNDATKCEDGFFISDKLAVVVDGVTSKTDKLFDGKKGGAFAKDVVLEVISQPGIENLSCTELFELLTISLKSATLRCFSTLETHEYPKCAIIIYNAVFDEIWSVGDCQCIINGVLHTHEKYVDTLNSNMRAYILEAELMKGASISSLLGNDVGREYILTAIKEQSVFENKEHPFGFSILNGAHIPESMIVKYKVKKGDTVVLASDGYPELCNSLEESERHLADILAEDPLCFRRYKCTKGYVQGNISFDDRCYCKFLV